MSDSSGRDVGEALDLANERSREGHPEKLYPVYELQEGKGKKWQRFSTSLNS